MKQSEISRKSRVSQLVKQSFNTALILSALTALTACGGSSGSSEETQAPPPAPTSTTFSLAVSDAPVDNASEVVVYFDEVELIGNGDPISFSVTDENGDPRSIDLLALPGAQFEVIVDDTEIPLGEYNQLRLSVTDESFIVMDDGTFPLRVPSGELKLDGFTAQPNFDAAYTVEFDLRKSLVDPVGQPVIMLKPRGVRLVLNDDVGTLEGTVDSALVSAPECAEKVDMFEGNAVYVYEGEQTDLDTLGDDADAGVDDSEVRPFTVVPVTYSESDETYTFSAGFVPQGDYSLSFSCVALNDEPETDEDEEDGFFLQTLDSATVTAGETTTVTIE
ncbi:MAG: DUF4382 domain-containing protein [Pseudomonadota bacterium]|jgi:hypothetical protein|nr:DUF4382 domain-containing protein [Pseudomonadota bacterium]